MRVPRNPLSAVRLLPRRSSMPRSDELRHDAVAALPGAISSVPDGMAASVLAGVNPIFGLYASFAGPIAGGLTSSTRLMVIAPTSAAALAAGASIATVDPADRPTALFLLTFVAGVAMVLAGYFHLGRYVRFVSHSVMIGFLTGVAANIVLGQLPTLTGSPAHQGPAIGKALQVVLHPGRIDVASLSAGAGALALLLVLDRTRLRRVSALVALVVPTVALLVVNASVRLVEDVGAIPKGLPAPHLPELGAMSVSVITGALSVALIVLVQGAGVAETAPNPGGPRTSVDADFAAQGFGNIASSVFRGVPVGGSVGNTAINVSAGAQGRWAAIISGVWMLVILVALSPFVGKVAMPTLAALLVYAAVGSVRPHQISMIMRTSAVSRIGCTVTFVATLFLPIQAAVAIGVALSLLLQLNAEAADLSVVELTRQPNGDVIEGPAPQKLSSQQVTVLDVHGSLLYAGSKTLQMRLPDPGQARRPVVVLRLRGRISLGATFFVVASDYAAKLEARGGRLYLSGVDAALLAQFERTGYLNDVEGPLLARAAQPVVGLSTFQAREEAEAWLVNGGRGEGPIGDDPSAHDDSRTEGDGKS